MATVYEARDDRLERAVALKVLPPEFLHAGAFAKRFEKEARVVARLEHRNIVPIYASGIDDGIPWMSMRLLPGGNMGSLLRKGRPDFGKALLLLRGVADALDYAHARGVVHRDIKPTNILLDGADGVFVGDFGLAQILDGAPGLTRTGTITGTPQYMAPELALGRPADHRSDIYSLGIVAYETFVGAVPFSAESPVAVLMKHVQDALPTPPYGLVPPALMRAIERAAAKDPADRWPSAGAFVTALSQAAGAKAYGLPSGPRTTRHFAWAEAMGGALVAAATVAWFVAHQAATSEPATSGPAAPIEEAREQPPDDAANNPPGPESDNRPPLTPLTPPNGPRGSSPGAVSNGPIPPVKTEELPPSPPPGNGGPATSSSSADVGDSGRKIENSDDRGPEVTPPTEELPSPPGPPPAPPLADVVTPPSLIPPIRSAYPELARAARLEGKVLLQPTVGVDGRVTSVRVLRGVDPILDEAARQQVLQYRYKPGLRNGVPEAAPAPPVIVTFEFR
jgi:serine/threonine-protein kinase